MKNLVASIIVTIALSINAVVIIILAVAAAMAPGIDDAAPARVVKTAVFQCIWLSVSLYWLVWSIQRFRRTQNPQQTPNRETSVAQEPTPEHQIPPDVHGDEPGQEFVPERSAGMPTPDKVLAVVLAVVTVIILIILIANFD